MMCAESDPRADADDAAARPSGRPDKKRRRWLIPTIIGGAVLLVLLIVVALVPTMLSSESGSRFIAGRVSEGLQGDVRIGSLSLSWFGPQQASDVVVVDEQGRETLTIDQAETGLSLFAAMRGRYDLGETHLSGVRADVVVDEAGETNLAQALSSEEPADPTEPTRVPQSLAFDLALSDARLTVIAPDMQPVVFEGIEAEAALASINDPLMIRSLTGSSRHAGVSGSFNANAELRQLFADDGELTLNRVRGSGNAQADDLPIVGIDRLLGMDGLLAAAVGDLANLRLAVETPDDQPQFMLAANAPRLQAQIHGVLNQNDAAIDQPANVDMQLEPELARRLFGLELQQAVPIELELTDFRTPIDGFNPARTAITGTVRLLEPAQFIDEQGQPFTLSNLQAAVQSENVAESLALQLDADLDVDGEQGAMNVDGQVAELFDAEGQLQLDQMQADFTADATNLPTVLVDRMMQQDGLLIEALGDRVSLQAEASSAGADQVDLQLVVDAPRLRTEPMNLRMDAEWITLVDPVRAELLVAPRVASQIVAAVNLAEPEPAVAIIHTLQAPRPAAGEPLFDPENTQVDFELVGQEAIHLLDLPQIDQALAENFELRINGPSLADLQLTLSGLLQDFDESGRIVDLAGSPIDTVLQVNTGLRQGGGLQSMQTLLTLSSDRINGRLNGTIAGDWSSIVVSEQSTLNVLLTRQMVAALDLEEQIDTTLLDEPLELAVTIDGLNTALPPDLAEMELDAVANLIAAAPQQRQDAFAIWLGGEQAQINVQTAPAEGEGQQTRLRLNVAAERLNGDLAADFSRDEDDEGETLTTIALVEPAQFQGVLSERALRMLNGGGQDAEPLLLEDAPITARITQLQGQVQPLAWPTLNVEAEIESDRIAIAAGALGGEIGQQLNPQQQGDGEQPQNGGIIISDVRSAVSFTGSEQRAEIQLTGQSEIIGEPAEPGRLDIQAVAQQMLPDGVFDFAAANVEADVDVNQLPTRLVAGLIGWQRQLVPLLGPLANIQAAAQWDGLPPRDGQIDAQIQTANFSTQLPLRIADGVLELVERSRSTLTVTPEAYDALMTTDPEEAGAEADVEVDAEPAAEAPAPSPPTQTLAEPGEIELELQSLRWPLPTATDGEADDADPAEIDPSQLSLVASLSSDGLTMVHRERPSERMGLSFNFQFNGEDLSRPAAYSLAGQLQPAASALADDDEADAQQEPADVAAIPSQTGEFQFDGAIADLIDSRGRPNFEAMTVSLEGEASDLPVAWLDELAGQEQALLASLGPALDLDVSGELRQFTGPISLRATATNGNAVVVGNLDDGVFAPSEPITANLNITETMGTRLLQQIHPILETAVGGEQPMALNVPAEGVRIPLRPFSLADAQIPTANIAVGQIAMRQGGSLASVLTGLERLFRQDLEAGEVVEAWFTPAVVELSNGRLRYERRMDVLIDQRIQLATWGEVDLEGERFSLTLGLPASMLQRAFGVRVPEGGMFTIPMTGSFGGAPQINWGRAATDIGRLTAQAELADQTPVPGLLDRVFGQLLDSDVPQPSVQPLPWADVPLEPLPAEGQAEPQPDAQQPDEPEEEEEDDRPRTPTLRDLFERIR